jgi:pilus assembly protein Flp/PilA
MRKFIQSLLRDERGVSALEYAILAGMIVVVVGVALTTFGDGLEDAFKALGDKVTAAVEKTS